MIKSNIHTHTQFCDGRATMEEMVQAALYQGFVSLGFSPHATADGAEEWSMYKDNVMEYFAELERLQQVYADRIEILPGLEFDSDSYAALLEHQYSYIIAAVHRITVDGRKWTIDTSADRLAECIKVAFGGDTVALAQHYYTELANFITSMPRVDVVAHLDLITKFIQHGVAIDTTSPNYIAAATTAIDRILSAHPDIIFEVNAGAMTRTGRLEPYPQLPILQYLAKIGVPVTITTDAHDTDTLCMPIDGVIDLCRKAGFGHIMRLRQKGWEKVDIISCQS